MAAFLPDSPNTASVTLKNPRSKHIQHIRFQGDNHNNKMERMNGEVRDREKVMRGLKKVDCIYCNMSDSSLNIRCIVFLSFQSYIVVGLTFRCG
jgi:hypothetical protein